VVAPVARQLAATRLRLRAQGLIQPTLRAPPPRHWRSI